MRQNQTLETALGISVAAHLIFFAIALHWWLPGAPAAVEQARKMFRLKEADLPAPAPARYDMLQSYTKTLKFENPAKAPMDTPISKSDPEKIRPFESDKRDDKLPAALSIPTSLKLKENLRATKEKIETPKRRIEKDAKLAVDLAAPSGSATIDPNRESDIAVPAPFSEEMFAFTPDKVSGQAPLQDVFRDIWGKGGTGSKYGALEHFMNISISKWKDPQDGQGYFELAIEPGKDAARLESMPKEITFLVDASLSIRGNRIEEFTKGVSYALKNLNKGDRYNLYTFKDDVTRFSPESVPAQSKDIGPAIRFLRKLEPSEATDVNRALLDSTRAKPASLPSYIVLLSDGRPTYGVTDSARVIEEISRVNSLRRSIFALSGGRHVNRYLLDFLTYQNRGWSEHAPRTGDITKRVSDFYDKIRDPLLINLRFQFNQLDAEEVFPKHLPDFFRNARLVVYGTYSDETEFSMRLLGDINGRTKELIFRGDLHKAKDGTSDIATAWAFNKIYYLISQATLGGRDEAAEREIRDLSKKFNITTPYDLGNETD